MAMNSIPLKLFSVVLVLMVASAPLAQAAITCGQVATDVAPCLNYLKGAGGPAPAPCCAGARNLFAAAKTTPDRQQACKCLKTIASSVPGINYGLAAGIPGKCAFTSPFKIALSTDCSRVQ